MDKEIIIMLRDCQIEYKDIKSLENFTSRDGFQRIKNDDLKNMLSFFVQYPNEFGDVIPIMTDDNSNYLCIYIKGKNKGKICCLSHDDGTIFMPIFANIENLVRVIDNNPNAWDIYELPEDSFDYN